MNQRTALYDSHIAAGAKIVDFAGWDMPIHYGSQIEEHHQVRQDAGMFDVSHMVVVDLRGARVRDFLEYLLANDVAKLKSPGKALYSCMLQEDGGIIDDLITYFLADDFYRMVVNAATREKDLAWITAEASAFDVAVDEQADLAMIAVQGPAARAKVAQALGAEISEDVLALPVFTGRQFGDFFVARTGYTGEDGFEVMVPASQAADLWSGLMHEGVKPCGLGARDTLRLEAGMNLYGTDMDESATPLESGLAWTVAMKDEREFIGRATLQKQKNNNELERFVGVVLEGRGVLRGHQKLKDSDGREGETTSGSFSPTLQQAIAMARVPAGFKNACEVEIRNRWIPARIVKMPFVRNGKSLI